MGKVSVPRGEFSEGTTYYLYNVVTFLGSAFMCTAESTTVAPATLQDDGETVALNPGWIFFADATAARSVGTQVSSLERDLDRTMSRVASPDDRALPLLCGQPPILFGAGTPKETVVPENWNQYDPATGEGYNWNGKPSAIGQQYVDTTAASGGRYIAARNGEWDLKWINC